MVGGDDAAAIRAATVLDHLAARVTHVGRSGAGQFVKLINQVLVGIGFSALAEIATMTRAADLDPLAVLSALTGGRADSALSRILRQVCRRRSHPHRQHANMVKDLGTAAAARIPNSPCRHRMVLTQNQELVAQGHGQGHNVNVMRVYGQIK